MLVLAVMAALLPLPANQARGAGAAPRLDWGAKTPMPTARRAFGLAAAPDGTLYAVGGFDTSTFQTVEMYNAATNTWSVRAPLPAARNRLGLAIAPNGKLYAVGGLVNPTPSGAPLDSVDEYDPVADRWTARAPLHQPRANFGLATARNGKLYAVGGIGTFGVLDSVEEYDPATDTWTVKRSMRVARSQLGLAAAPNGKLYAVGGAGSSQSCPPSSFCTSVEEYDPATDTWQDRAPLSVARLLLGVAAASNGKLYAVGGFTDTTVTNVVEAYDPTTDTWGPQAAMPTARGAFGLAGAPNGKLYAVGGEDTNARSGIVEEYDPQANTWAGVRTAPLPLARTFPTSAVAGGKLYVFGGFNAGNPLDSVLQYDAATNAWPSMTSMPTARYGSAAVTAPNGKIYVVGGSGTGALCPSSVCMTVEEYTPPTGAGGGTWRGAAQGISQLPAARVYPAIALGSDGKLYVSGGYDGSTGRPETYQYDPTTNGPWQSMASLHNPRLRLGLAPAGDGKLYAVGGEQVDTSVTTVERFVLPTPGSPQGAWEGPSGITQLPSARTGLGLVGLPNGRLVAAGGSDSSSGSTPRADVYEYDPTANAWEARPPLPTARFALSLALLGTRQLFASGGFKPGPPLATVEEGGRDELPSVGTSGPYTVLGGSTVQLAAIGSDPEGDPLSYAWDLDGSLLYATPGQNVTFSPAGFSPGTRAIRVRALDPLGGYAVASTTLTIVEATRLTFATQPGGAQVGAPLSPQPVVRVEGPDGTLISTFNGPVTLALAANTSGGTLSGTTTVNAVNGVVTFAGLVVTAPGTGLALVASSGSLQTASSAPFTVTAPAFCGPRPNVAVATTRAGPGQLQAVVTAQTLPATPANSLQRIAITRIENATLTLNGSPMTAGASITLLAGTSQVTLLVQRQNPGASSTVSFVATDSCGDWRSFVGGGPGAF